MTLGAEHCDVAAIRMPDQRQVIVVSIRLQVFQLLKHEQNIGFTFFIDRAPADVRQADGGHQWRIGRKVLLDAGDQIAPGCKDIRQE